WDSAAVEFQTAIRRDEGDVEAHLQYARYLLFRGRHADALNQLRTARAKDPASALVLGWIAYSYFLDGQMDSAMIESGRALENDSLPWSSIGLGALIRIGSNRLSEARELLKRMS